VNFLKENRDPRLTVWIKPVDVQTVIEDRGGDKVYEMDANGKVKKYLRSIQSDADTSLFVGLPIALANPDNFNGNTGEDRNLVTNMDPSIYMIWASNPFVSYFKVLFRENCSAYHPGTFITASEVNFLSGEAFARAWISGSAVEYNKQCIQSSLHQYDIADKDVNVYNHVTHQI